MKSSSKRALVMIAVLAVALAITLLARLPGPSDQEQILAQMQSAATAAQHHNVNGIMKIVSAHYQDSNGFNNDQLSLFLHRLAGNKGSVTVLLATPAVLVHGDLADSVGQVTVHPVEGGSPYYDQPVTLHWKREDGTKWLFFPAKVWRVVGAQYPPPGGGDFSGGLL